MAAIQQRVRVQTDDERDEVWNRRVGRLKRRAWRRRLLNAFIVWHIFAVTVWLLPSQWSPARLALPADGSGLVRAYMTATGMVQGWHMFTPNPDNRNIEAEVLLKYKDGTQRTWTAPRIKDMGYVDKYRRERMRKWVEMASVNPLLWYSLVHYAARRNNSDPHNPPVSALLIEHIQVTPPPGQPTLPAKTVPLCRAVFTPEELR